MDTTRLAECGWSSFRPELFLNEPGRRTRDVGAAFVSILNDFCVGNSILELCCGAGRLCIELAQAGYEVTGIDLDDRMLSIGREILGAEPPDVQSRVQFLQEDVAVFDLGKQFDFVIFEDDGFVYLLEQEEQLACLERVCGHLRDDSKFLLVFATPQRELDENYAEGMLSCRGFEYEPVRQVKQCECTWTLADQHGVSSHVHEGFERRRLTYPQELELLLRVSGLQVLRRWGSLDRAPFVNPEQQEYHYLCSRA